MQKKKGKGSSPNSHGNRRIGDGIAEAREVTMLANHWAIAKAIGEGNCSQGLRRALEYAATRGAISTDKLFVQLPLFEKAKIAIDLLAEGEFEKAQEIARAISGDLESLEIEELYTEARLDGIIKPSKGAIVA